MSTTTQDEIAAVKAVHAELSERIAKLEAATAEAPFFEYQAERIALQAGEIYIGTIQTAGEYGSYHLILLPGDQDDASWKRQMDWAASIGGELPNRVESALLFATRKSEFLEATYWCREEHASASDYAWFQGFSSGYQSYGSEASKLRARAVRRLVIE